MAITFFGVASSPADNSGLTGPTLTMTPPASMQDGDLVLVSVRYRASTASITNSVTGGQAWTAETQYDTTNIRARLFWCRFNGTWAADPQFTITTGTNAIDAQMLVFRPTSAAHTWSLDAAPATATYAAPSTPFTVTVTGRDTVAASTVTLAAWHSVDNNTWGTLSGTGWSKTSLGAQYRNTNNSSTYAYNIRTSQGTVANVSQNQASLGGDAGSVLLVTFAETLVTAAISGVASTLAAGSLGIALATVGLAGLESAAAAGTTTVDAGGAAENAAAEPGAVVANASVGSVLVHIGAAPSGVAATAAAGSLASAITTLGIAGVAATTQAGIASVEGAGASNAETDADGVEATAQVGTLAPIALALVAPSGTGIGATAAALVPHVGAVPAGVSAAAAAGDATGAAASAGAVPIPSVVANAAAGLLAGATTTAGIAGAQSTAAAGTATVDSGGIILGAGQPSAVFATAQIGNLAVAPLILIPGAAITATAEAIGSSVLSAEIDGVSSAAAAGEIGASIRIPIGGVQAVAAAGSPSIFANAAPTLTSVQSVATVGNLVGLTEAAGSAGIEGVQAPAQVGALRADWTADFTLDGVELTASANDMTVQAGDNESTEVFPSGVAATAQVGALSTGEARAAIPSVGGSVHAGTISVIAEAPIPFDKPDEIGLVPMLAATLSMETVLQATIRVTPVS